MSRSLRRDDGFYLRATPPNTYEPIPTSPRGRRCITCDTILSIYNTDDYCAPCNRKAAFAHFWRFGPCPVCGTARTMARQKFCSRECELTDRRIRIEAEYNAKARCEAQAHDGERCVKAIGHPRGRHSWSGRKSA